MKVIERVKNNKTLLILFFLILLCLILMLFRLTKSYLDSKIEDEQEVDVDVTAQQTDDLKFIEGNPLSLNVNPTTLPQNGSNLVSTTHPRVELLANDASNSATYNYYVYVKITNNTFTYSDGSTPEILLSITNPSNTAVTSISGLTYVTQNGVSGFDVTNYNGLITVATNYAITSSNSTTATVQNWTFTLTYLNLDIDQSANIDKSMDTEILFLNQEFEYPFIYRISSYSLAHCGTSGVYTFGNRCKIDEINSSVYSFDPPASGYKNYLKHNYNFQNEIISSYVCFRDGGFDYCLKGYNESAYSQNRDLLLNTQFSTITCTDNTTSVTCSGSFSIECNDNGYVDVEYISSEFHCYISSGTSISSCYQH